MPRESPQAESNPDISPTILIIKLCHSPLRLLKFEILKFCISKFNWMSGVGGHLDIGNSGIKFWQHSGGYSITSPQHDMTPWHSTTARWSTEFQDRSKCENSFVYILCSIQAIYKYIYLIVDNCLSSSFARGVVAAKQHGGGGGWNRCTGKTDQHSLWCLPLPPCLFSSSPYHSLSGCGGRSWWWFSNVYGALART